MVKNINSIIWLALSLLALELPQASLGSKAMKRLYEDLFTDYNKLIVPVAVNKTKVTVTLGLKLGQILDLNLKQQILSTNVWVEQTWLDYRLEWMPEAYEGIDMIHVPAENIWIPDIVLYNNADGNYELTLVAKATLYSNGTVVWKPPTMFRSTCEIDVEYFPFDIQTCFLRFASWTYAGDELELRHIGGTRKVDIGIDLSQFYKNVEWDIIDVPAYYNENYYECCAEPYPDITFKIVIRRKMLFYLVNLILPVALMTFMTVSVFYLPSDSNEKVTLSISILTSLIVFFLLMLEIIPASSLAVPLFGKYLLFTLVLVSLSACVSVYVLNIHHRSPAVHSMSPRMRLIFLKILPRILQLDQPDPRERSSLNRFRKKKLAQQQASSNKVYDLAQPLAASLNLIDTLNRSYNFNPADDDDRRAKPNEKLQLEDRGDHEGRYFRRYVDDYIESMTKTNQANGPMNRLMDRSLGNRVPASGNRVRCDHVKCCPRANQPLLLSGQSHCSCDKSFASTRNQQLGCRRSLGTTMLHDDTLDMTFDYDDQDGAQIPANVSLRAPVLSGDGPLPTPPPPPIQLSQLGVDQYSGELNGRLSGCGQSPSNQRDDGEDSDKLVDKLFKSINIMNDAPDGIDTTTTMTSTTGSSINGNTTIYGPQMQSDSADPLIGCQVHSQRQQCNLRSPVGQGAEFTTSVAPKTTEQPSDLLVSLSLPYDQMPAHVRAAIRSILFIADTIKNEDDENSAIEDWESMSMVVDRLFLWIFFILCTFGSIIILALAPSLYDQRASIDDKLRIDIPLSNCSASVYAHS